MVVSEQKSDPRLPCEYIYIYIYCNKAGPIRRDNIVALVHIHPANRYRRSTCNPASLLVVSHFPDVFTLEEVYASSPGCLDQCWIEWLLSQIIIESLTLHCHTNGSNNRSANLQLAPDAC